MGPVRNNKLKSRVQGKPIEATASDQAEKATISLLAFVSQVLSGPEGLDSKIKSIIGRLRSFVNADAVLVHLFEEDGRLYLRAHEGLIEEALAALEELAPGEGFIGEAFTGGRVVSSPPGKAAGLKGIVRTGPVNAVCVPLRTSLRVWGVLTLAGGDLCKSHDQLDEQVLDIIGGQLGVAIENSRLISQLHGRMEQIELINELSSAINSSLSIGTVFRIMVSEIKKMVSFDRSSLLLYNEKEDNLLIFALETEMKTVMPKGIKAPVEGTSAGWVVRNNRPVVNRDFMEELRFPGDKKLLEDGIRSSVSIPLFQDKMLGVFNLDSTRPGAYSEQHLGMLVPVANQISIALENALLFEEVSREKKEWEKTFDAISDMVWIEDVGQRVIRANQALLTKVGLSVSQLDGMHCKELMSMIGLSQQQCLCEQAAPFRTTTFREIRGDAGSTYHFWGYPLKDDDGNTYSVVHYLKDVTAQKRIEQQLIRNDKLASLGILGAGIAHEINNPLGIIAGFTEALMDRAGNAELRSMSQFTDFPEYLDTIHKEIFRCKELLGSLLGFAMPLSGKSRSLDINEIIMEVMLLVKHKVKSLNYDMALNLNRKLPPVCADPGSLRQLIMNVIMNAIYFTPDGGRIEVRTLLDNAVPALEGEEPPPEMVAVSVKDSGAGIPKEAIDRIFDPFFTTKPIGEGSGLGLSICHKIAEDHGGMIDAESQKGQGTVFTIRLPAGGCDD